MMSIWRQSGLYLCKFFNAQTSCSWFLHNREMHINMNDNPFLPPSNVKGMTVLDKEKFKKVVTVPCLYLPLKSISDAKKPLKPYLLKFPNFQPLSNASVMCLEAIKKNAISAIDEDGKMAVLDPRRVKSFTDLQEKDRLLLEAIGVNEDYMAVTEIALSFDNYKADEILRAVIPSEFDSVSGYSLVGHIIHLNIRAHLAHYKNIIGLVLLEKVKPARTVVNKIDIIDSTFRNFHMELLCGDNDMITKVRENGCTFEFDFSKVYWNPRLGTEHEKVVECLKKGDILYDVFCGVGPFAVPAAKKGCTVLANDLNPHSVEWLKSNLKHNKIKGNLKVFNKDGHEFIKNDIKQHMLTLNKEECGSINIVMNLPALAPTFLRSFQHGFSEDEISIFDSLPSPKVFVYCFVKGEFDHFKHALQLISGELGLDLKPRDEEVVDVSFVRNVAPNKSMMRVTLLLTRKILLSPKRALKLDEHEQKRLCH